MVRSELIDGSRNSKKYGMICPFYEMCMRESVDMREDLMAARYCVARQFYQASVVELYGTTYSSCYVGMTRHPEHQSHFTKPKSELRQERKDPI
jgi:hypothetical protein